MDTKALKTLTRNYYYIARVYPNRNQKYDYTVVGNKLVSNKAGWVYQTRNLSR